MHLVRDVIVADGVRTERWSRARRGTDDRRASLITAQLLLELCSYKLRPHVMFSQFQITSQDIDRFPTTGPHYGRGIVTGA